MLKVSQQDQVIINVWTSEENNQLRGANVGHISVATNLKYMSFWPAVRTNQERAAFAQKSDLSKELIKLVGQYFQSRSPKYIQTYEMDSILEALSEGHADLINYYSDKSDAQTAILCNTDTHEITVLHDDPGAIAADQIMYAVTPCHANVRLALYSLDKGKIHHKFAQLQPTGWQMAGSNVLQRLITDKNPENCASFAYQLLQAGGLQSLLDIVNQSSFSSGGSGAVKPDMFVPYLIKAKDKECQKYSDTKNWTFSGETDMTELKKAYGIRETQGNNESRNIFSKGI